MEQQLEKQVAARVELAVEGSVAEDEVETLADEEDQCMEEAGVGAPDLGLLLLVVVVGAAHTYWAIHRPTMCATDVARLAITFKIVRRTAIPSLINIV